MWNCAGDSVIGTAHTANGLPCQDFCGWRNAGAAEGRLLIALSDGAGFARHADAAAQIAVAKAIELMGAFSGSLQEICDAEVLAWMNAIKTHLQSEAAAAQCEISDFACTLLGAVIEGDTGYFWQIGDGGWVVQSTNGIEVVMWPHSGEFINQTVFVTSEKATEHWTHALMSGISHVAGFTDGLEHLMLDYISKKAHEPFTLKLFNALGASHSEADVTAHIRDFLNSNLINERTDDDKTLVLAWRNSPPAHADG